MRYRKSYKVFAGWLLLSLCLAMGFGVSSTASQRSDLTLLGRLQQGEWTIKFRADYPDIKVCIRTGEELIELRHQGKECNRFVVKDQTSEVTVQYTCRGDGYGRTEIRREREDLVQIESQGIANGTPFQFVAEARRTGECAD